MISPNLWFEGRTGSGMPVFFHETVGFAAAGHRVSLCLYDHRRRGEDLYQGVRIRYFGVPGGKWGGGVGRAFDGIRALEYLAPACVRAAWQAAYTWQAVRRALPVARAGRFDLVYGHTYWSAAAACLLARRMGVPAVLRYYGAQDLGVHARERRLALKYFDRLPAYRLPLARIVMTDDGSFDPAIARAFGADPGHVLCLKNGVDHVAPGPPPNRDDWRRALGLEAGTPVVLSLSRLSPEKRVDVLLHAAARFLRRFPEAAVVIAGEGTQRPRLEGLARELDIARRVRFAGLLDRAGVRRALRCSDVLVSAYRTASFSNQLWEAMAAGLPAVLADQGQGSRYITDGVTGLLVADDGDDAALAGRLAPAVGRLLGDGALRARIAALAAQWVADAIPGWDERIARGVRVFEEVLASAGSRAGSRRAAPHARLRDRSRPDGALVQGKPLQPTVV